MIGYQVASVARTQVFVATHTYTKLASQTTLPVVHAAVALAGVTEVVTYSEPVVTVVHVSVGPKFSSRTSVVNVGSATGDPAQSVE
jgi:hypothetical protein